MKACSYQFLIILAFLLLLAACSTTSHLPEGEILYTGVKDITYPQDRKHKKKSSKDSTGVIVAIAESVQRVDEVLSGKSPLLPDSTALASTPAVDKEEARKELQALEIAREEVNAVLEYAPNNALFGDAYHRTPFPMGLWAYNRYVNRTSALSRWMFKSFASQPVLVSTVNPATRIKVATNTLHNYGFFQGKVTYELHPYGKRKAKIGYQVSPGKVFRLDSIAYAGFPAQADSMIQATRKRSLLRSGDPFNVLNLTGEQSRLESLFRGEGYYFYRASYATYKADTVMRPYKVQLVMTPQAKIPPFVTRRWYIGNLHVHMTKQDTDTTRHALRLRHTRFDYNGDKIPLRPGVWFRNVAHRPGSLYRQADQDKTQELLSSLGVFSQYNVNYVPRDTTMKGDTLDVHIYATLDKPYMSNLEMNITEKNSDRISPGLSFSLQRKNVFRGGELLDWKIYGSYEWRTHHDHLKGSNFFNSYEVGSVLSLNFGHILFPGFSLRSFRFPTQTRISVNADWMNRTQYYNLFSLGLDVAYSWKKHSTTTHEFIPFSLYYDKLLSYSTRFDSIMQENPALYISMRDRLVPSMKYTVTYQSASRHRNALWWQLSIKEAGNVTSALFALAGQPFSRQDKQLFRNPFAQYIRIASELHNNFRITQKHRIVTRLSAGLLYAYGNSEVAPYSDQFFVGGANSVRAFTIRTVGPGHYASPRNKYSYMDQTGDVKLEANVEYRFPLMGSLNGAVFLDAGNVWLLRDDPARPGGKFRLSSVFRDMALGTGAGLRYDMDFLVLRLDWGIALHDPANNEKKGFYNISRFKDGMALHFAIGYPF